MDDILMLLEKIIVLALNSSGIFPTQEIEKLYHFVGAMELAALDD